MLYLLEDDADLAKEVLSFLEEQGHELQLAGSIQAFRALCAQRMPDIAILDRSLPDGDGMSLLDELNKVRPRVGVLLFTAKGGPDERIEGLERGADYYLPKPVRLQELGAVVQSIKRRLGVTQRWQLFWPRCELHAASGECIHLTGQEAAFLHALLLSQGQVVSRRMVVENMGKNYLNYDMRNLDTLLLRLRKKVAGVSSQPLPVKTIHGTGYMVSSDMALMES